MKLALRQPSPALAVLALLGAAAVATAADPPKPSRAIRVQGNQFVDAVGKPVVFRGVALSDPDKLERQGHWNRRIFEEMKAWGANIVRLRFTRLPGGRAGRNAISPSSTRASPGRARPVST